MLIGVLKEWISKSKKPLNKNLKNKELKGFSFYWNCIKYTMNNLRIKKVSLMIKN